MAEHLALREDLLVFGTVRSRVRPPTTNGTRPSPVVTIPHLDLTRNGQIRRAVRTIRSKLRSSGLDSLYAIISNAGGGVIAPLELLNMGVLKRELQTRIVGAATLVQMLLPEIRRGNGRLVWITTPGPIPLAYKSSVHIAEFALHGLARTFRIELARWNISSIMIACGGIKSNAVARMDQELSRRMKTLTTGQLALYGRALKAVLERDKEIAKRGVDPIVVAETVEAALDSPHPKPTYQVGLSKMLSSLSSLPPSKLDRFFMSMIQPERRKSTPGAASFRSHWTSSVQRTKFA